MLNYYKNLYQEKKKGAPGAGVEGAFYILRFFAFFFFFCGKCDRKIFHAAACMRRPHRTTFDLCQRDIPTGHSADGDLKGPFSVFLVDFRGKEHAYHVSFFFGSLKSQLTIFDVGFNVEVAKKQSLVV